MTLSGSQLEPGRINKRDGKALVNNKIEPDRAKHKGRQGTGRRKIENRPGQNRDEGGVRVNSQKLLDRVKDIRSSWAGGTGGLSDNVRQGREGRALVGRQIRPDGEVERAGH